MSDKNIIISVAGVLFVVGAVLFVVSDNGGSPTGAPTENGGVMRAPTTPVEHFAQCLKDKGAIFYGAFWCSHCKTQKALFGDAVPFLPYVECSTSDGKAQTKVCINKKIEGYPTWEFADGSRLSGEQSFAALGEKSGCPVPAEK